MKKIFISIFFLSFSVIAVSQNNNKATAPVFAPEPKMKNSGKDAQTHTSEKIIFTEMPEQVLPKKTPAKMQPPILFTPEPSRIPAREKTCGTKSE